ncbi:D-ribose 1,5-phosphomutase [Gracilibacillus boraciitolerans JCM 21714]|uniref:Phosphoglucomutase n=2 Tax=Gracilibacillus boraciitolerans TaxID=307521 RepID=W4VHF0_9BACI|nr:D-ribose 1,5-phosphomutase [Gracilibacillus boraciitolerans JCM 21714]
MFNWNRNHGKIMLLLIYKISYEGGGNNMSWQDTFKKWTSFAGLDEDLLNQLNERAKNEKDLEDSFYKDLEFGTGGMRGMLGPGTNRLNIYTIRKAVEGLANYISKHVDNSYDKGVVIAYDSRYMSQTFAVEAARVLGAHGIKAYVFESIRPTPLLSFAVRHLKTAAGIMITASHNPPEYNGFKIYNEDGGQVPLREAAAIIEEVNKIEDELNVSVKSQDEIEREGLLEWVGGENVDQAYLQQLKTIRKQDKDNTVKIVFTPLHGTSYDLIMRGLAQSGFENIYVVEEQANLDPEFSTVSSPNPEEHQAFEMAIKKGLEKDADILIGSDPDGDRLGVAVKNKEGSYQVLTGNQLGSLLLDYTLSQQAPSALENGQVIKTIVTTEMGRAIASHYGVNTMDTLTGFKFIGEKIKEFESNEKHFLFGYEESYGYLIGDFVRDKDAVQAALAACEAANYWKAQGKSLLEALDTLYEQHGYYLEGMESLTLKGKDGAEQIETIMADIRKQPFEQLGELDVIAVEDYHSSERILAKENKQEAIDLPKENVMKFLLENDAWVCFRPSGTEPKIKSYFGVKTKSATDSKLLLEKIQTEVEKRMNNIINA